MDRVIPILASIAVLGVVAALFVQLFRNAGKEAAARSWPTVEATIQSAQREMVGSGRYAVELPCYAFSYVVDGEYHSGRFGLVKAIGGAGAPLRDMVDKKLTIQYDPKRPSSFRIPSAMIEGCQVHLIRD
jgi:hypothetical protein